LETTCGLILRDEGGHVAFHRDRLAVSGQSLSGPVGKWWAMQFVLCGYAAGTMLWINHGPCLKSLGATTSEFYSEITHEMRRFLKLLAMRQARYGRRRGKSLRVIQSGVSDLQIREPAIQCSQT
jgi:hypothetical protein